MENENYKKIIHFTHWTRNGITSLIKTIVANSSNENVLFLLESDKDFNQYYSDIHTKFQFFLSGQKIKAFLSIIKKLRESNADIIHAHSFTPFMLAAIFSGKSKVIFHLHSEYPYLYQKSLKSKLKRASIYLVSRIKPITFFAVTERAAKLIENITRCTCQYIPNGIPDKGTQRDNFNSVPNKNRFYSVGRLDAQKNVSYAIDLFHKLQCDGLNFSYSIYGSGIEMQRLQSKIDALGLSSSITLEGFTGTPENLPQNYDFFISTSKQEGLSLSALHGMRGKTPVITTTVGQIGQIISHRSNGFFLTGNIINDIETMREIIFMSEPKKTEIQENARKIYLEKFTEKTLIARILFEYEQL